MKHIVRITNDTSLNGIPTVKMECGCGWVEKCVYSKAERLSQQHLRLRHNKGIVHYDGVKLEVRR